MTTRYQWATSVCDTWATRSKFDHILSFYLYFYLMQKHILLHLMQKITLSLQKCKINRHHQYIIWVQTATSYLHLWHVRCLWDSSLTSPTMAGSKVGSWYTARSLVFSAPVANRVWEGFKAILWIPQGHSAGILFLLLFREGMWNCFPVLVSRTISWNWVGNLMELGQMFYQRNKFLHTIHISFTIPCYI